jgi:hypothetical protein
MSQSRDHTITKENMIDGDTFEQLAHDLGLFYVRTHDARAQLKNISHQLGQANVLSHNSDGCILLKGTPTRWFDFEWDGIPDNVGHWFAQNISVRDPRLIPIPIGLERRRAHPEAHKKDVILSLPRTGDKRLAYLNASPGTNPNRPVLYQRFTDCDWCTTENGVSFPVFARQMRSHKFTFSPDGNGLDTHRTWEALYLGSFPIVERHSFTEEFARDLPLLIVDDWAQVTENWLNHKYTEFASREWNWDMLSMCYWVDLIRRIIT